LGRPWAHLSGRGTVRPPRHPSLHADLRAVPGCLAAHHPVVVINEDGHASIQLDVTAVDIWLALLDAMVSVKGVFHEPLAVRVLRSMGS